jgi:hypothetical protein
VKNPADDTTAATDAQVWSVVELWDFGVAIDITPPGPGEVLAPSEAYRLAEEEPHGRKALSGARRRLQAPAPGTCLTDLRADQPVRHGYPLVIQPTGHPPDRRLGCVD